MRWDDYRTWPGFQLARTMTVLPPKGTSSQYLWERKLDGVRAMVSPRSIRLRGDVVQNKGLLMVGGLGVRVPLPEGWVLDGEVMLWSPEEGFTGHFTGIYPALNRSQWDSLVFVPFDAVMVANETVQSLTLLQRLRLLLGEGYYPTEQIAYSMPTRPFPGPPPEHWEGLIAKNLSSPYVSVRSPGWVKWKHVRYAVVQIMGFEEGKNSMVGMLGALHIGIVVKGVLRPIGKVGTGFDKRLRQNIWERRSQYHGRQIRVGYTEVSKDGKLRDPRFLGFQD